jgi:hypothetical protein
VLIIGSDCPALSAGDGCSARRRRWHINTMRCWFPPKSGYVLIGLKW